MDWKDIHNRVKEVLREVFQGAAAVHPEMNSPTSRAIYGVDIMLDASFQPKLLEVIFKYFLVLFRFYPFIVRGKRIGYPENLAMTRRNLAEEVFYSS